MEMEINVMSTTAPYQAPSAAPGPIAQNPIAPAPAPTALGSSVLSISSLVLGLMSIFAGWTILAPIAGFILGILALSREPHNRTMAIWGIVLNAVTLAGTLLLVELGLAFGLAFLPFAFLPFDFPSFEFPPFEFLQNGFTPWSR